MNYFRLVLLVLLGGCLYQSVWDISIQPTMGTGISKPAPGWPLRSFYNLHRPVTFIALGDTVMHLPIVNSVLQQDGSYNFRPIFSGLKPILDQADIATCVLETPLSGTPGAHYTGYPEFNCPGALADGLRWAGINLVFTAHNHCLDRRFAGVRATLDYLDRIGLAHVGTRGSSEQPRYLTIAVKDIKMTFLAYTTTTNGIPLPEGREWAVNFFDYGKIAVDIAAARKAGTDCIVMALHTGTEYRRMPTEEQQEMADRLLAMGVDIIIGSHVHVIEPWERRIQNGAGDNPRSCFVAYSLGNLLSNQRWRFSDCGLLLMLTLQKKVIGAGVDIVNVAPLPIWVDRYREQGHYRYRIIPTYPSSKTLGEATTDPASRRRLQEVWKETFHLDDIWVKQRFQH